VSPETAPETAPEPAIDPGSLLAGRYRVDEVVASGGFGVVHAGRHLVLDTKVAIKLLRPERFAGGDRGGEIAAFLDEARTLAKLRHPNIVSVLDAGIVQATGLPFIVLEWCDGPTLKRALEAPEARRGLSPEAGWALLRPIALGIAHAHAEGVAHRDLKPSNVALVPRGDAFVPRVLDFGVAKASTGAPPSGDTHTQSLAAFTPAYAAPEQVLHARTGPWTDVHALALVFVELLLGREAYGGPNPLEDAVDPVRPTPRALGLDVSDALEETLARALARKPAQRFADAAAFVDAMDAVIEDHACAPTPWLRPMAPSTSAPPVARTSSRRELATLTERTGSAPRRRPRAGAWLAWTLLVILPLGGAAMWLRDRGAAAPPPSVASPRPAELRAGGLAWRVQDGSWREEEGTLVGSGGQVISTNALGDGTLELDVASLTEGASHAVGVGFRAQLGTEREDGSGYGVNFRLGTDRFDVLEGRAGAWSSVVEQGRRGSPSLRARDNHVLVRARGGHFEIEINGERAASFDDATYASGGLTLWVQSHNERVRFSGIHFTAE
jgi:hypothetical protein